MERGMKELDALACHQTVGLVVTCVAHHFLVCFLRMTAILTMAPPVVQLLLDDRRTDVAAFCCSLPVLVVWKRGSAEVAQS